MPTITQQVSDRFRMRSQGPGTALAGRAIHTNMSTCVGQVKPGCAAVTNTPQSQGLTLTSVSSLRHVCSPHSPLAGAVLFGMRLHRGKSSGGSPHGSECPSSKGPQVPSAQNSLARAGHRAPRTTRGPGRAEHRDFGGLPKTCSIAALADVLCPAASPHLPHSPRLLPTSLLDTRGTQDHGPHAGLLGPHWAARTPRGMWCRPLNLTPPGVSCKWNPMAFAPFATGLFHCT